MVVETCSGHISLATESLLCFALLPYLFDGDRSQDRYFATDGAVDSQEAQSKVG